MTMIPNKPKVSVFIPTLNRAVSLKSCLESITRQEYNNFEVIIGDGGSTDNTEQIINEYSKKIPIIYFRQTKEGIIGAANEAIEECTGDIFTRIDDDVIVTPIWLDSIVKTFQSDPKIGGVTGPTIIPENGLNSRDLTFFNKKMKEKTNLFWRVLGNVYYNYFLEGKYDTVSKFFRSGAFSMGSNYPECLKIEGLQEVDTLEACNWSCRKNLLENVGGFDEKFLKGLGDCHEADVPFKIRKLGYKLVFNAKCKVVHNIGGGKVPSVRPRSYWRSQNFILFYFRHIKPNTLDKFFRFSSYLIFINAYWIYKFLTTRNLSLLMGIPGTFTGLIKYLPELKS